MGTKVCIIMLKIEEKNLNVVFYLSNVSIVCKLTR